jgi:hypothetical protein
MSAFLFIGEPTPHPALSPWERGRAGGRMDGYSQNFEIHPHILKSDPYFSG